MSCIKCVRCVRSFRKITLIKKFPQIDIWSATSKQREQYYCSSNDKHDKSTDQGEKSNDKSEKFISKSEQLTDKNVNKSTDEDNKSLEEDEPPVKDYIRQMRSRILQIRQKIDEIRHKIYTNTKILVPFHFISTLFWFGLLLQLCYSEVDMIAFLQKIDLTSSMLAYFKDSSIGELTIAFFILKITKPFRYGVSLAVTLLVTRFCEKYGYEVPDIFVFFLKKLKETIEKHGEIEKQKIGKKVDEADMKKLNATPVDADIRPAAEQDSAMKKNAKQKKAVSKKKVISNLVTEELTKIIEDRTAQPDKLQSTGTKVKKSKNSAKANGAAKERSKSKQIKSAEDNTQTVVSKNDEAEEKTKGSAQEDKKGAKEAAINEVKSENVMEVTPRKDISGTKQTGTTNIEPSTGELNAKQMTVKQQQKSTNDAAESGKAEETPAKKNAEEISKQATKMDSAEDTQLSKNADEIEHNMNNIKKPPDNRKK